MGTNASSKLLNMEMVCGECIAMRVTSSYGSFVHPKDLGVQMNMDDGEEPSTEVNETSVEEVNAREEGGVVVPVGIQHGGVADEGETVGAIVDEMEREDSNDERVEEGDSSDDETDINPAQNGLVRIFLG